MTPSAPGSVTAAIARPTTRNLMLLVLAAMAPGVILQTYWFGLAVPGNIALAAITCVVAEVLCQWVRTRHWPSAVATSTDGSALVTGVLFAACLPAATPYSVILVGAALAIVLGKQIYGGLGQNIFNPAMVGYVIALSAWPADTTNWALMVDGVTAPTALAALDLQDGLTLGERWQPANGFGAIGGLGFEWINAAFLIGGVVLLTRGVVSWHAPMGMLCGLGLPAAFAFTGDSDQAIGSPLLHWFSGGTMLCAWFIATDPVSGPAARTRQFWFGAGVGLITFLIRTFGAHPDGAAYAILIMNAAAPLLDQGWRKRNDRA